MTLYYLKSSPVVIVLGVAVVFFVSWGVLILSHRLAGPIYRLEKDLQDIIAFIKEMKVADIFLYFLKYYPGSKAIDYALKHGYKTKDDFETYHEGRDIAYYIVPDRFQAKKRELYKKYNKLMVKHKINQYQ